MARLPLQPLPTTRTGPEVRTGTRLPRPSGPLHGLPGAQPGALCSPGLSIKVTWHVAERSQEKAEQWAKQPAELSWAKCSRAWLT